MKTNILTLFDKNYALRGLAFYEALAKLGDYEYWFLCADEESRSLFADLKLPGMHILS